ncbi:MAG: hypothetical protein M5U16_01475 [Hyphomicrobium sp.]|nr:hypothetical protein [Hyphomicrobium sp.]
MKQQRAPFMPVSTDLDAELERLAHDKGVGALVKPASPEPRAGEGAAAKRPAKPAAPKIETAAPPEGAATPRSRMKALSVELPDYVWTDLKIRAAHGQTSVRHVIMTALQTHGVSIAEADMIEDGRRIRGSNRTD